MNKGMDKYNIKQIKRILRNPNINNILSKNIVHHSLQCQLKEFLYKRKNEYGLPIDCIIYDGTIDDAEMICTDHLHKYLVSLLHIILSCDILPHSDKTHMFLFKDKIVLFYYYEGFVQQTTAYGFFVNKNYPRISNSYYIWDVQNLVKMCRVRFQEKIKKIIRYHWPEYLLLLSIGIYYMCK